MGIVRSATTDPVAAGMMRRLLAEGPFLAIARAIELPDARLRATLAGTQLMGLVMARYVVLVEPHRVDDARRAGGDGGPDDRALPRRRPRRSGGAPPARPRRPVGLRG